MKKNTAVVCAVLLYILTPAIGLCENKNLIGKGAGFETKSIRMKLYKNVPELSQF